MTEAAPAYYEADAAAVVVRVAALPLSLARRLLDERLTEEEMRLVVAGDPRILPALQIASPALFEATTRWLAGRPQFGKLLHKLNALLLRMSTRATPLGAYSSVTLMSPDDPAPPACESGLHTASRPDMEWLHSVIDLAEGEAESRRNLLLYTNPVHRRRGDHLLFPSLRRSSGAESGRAASLYVTPRVDYCIREARSGALWSQLANRLAHEFPLAEPEPDELIARLLSDGLLQTELRPDLLGDPWQAACGALSRAQASFWPALSEIATELRRFENASLADWDVRRFAAVLEKMRAVSATPHQVQTDATRSVEGSLPRPVLQDALLLGELMLRGSPVSGLGRLRARFAESYEGTTRLVPLLEFIDDDADAAIALAPEPSGGSTARTLRLLELYSRTAGNRDEEIVLSDEQLRELLPPAVPLHELPNAIEVGFSVFARSAQALAEGEYTIAPASVPGTTGAARTVGRFSHLLSPAQRKQAAAARRRSMDPRVLHAELSYHPSKRRLGNVAIRPCDYDFHLCLSHRHEGGEALDVGDLYVGLDARTHAFFLYSHEKRRRVQIETSNVLNVWAESPLVRFLQMLRDDRKRTVSPFDWGSLSFAPALPRVRYRNLVLSPRRWNVLTADLKAQDLERAVAGWRTAWNVPRVVLLAHGDRKIPCDLESGFGLESIREALSHDALMIEFVEWPAADGTWLSDGKTTYCAEFYLTAHRTGVPAGPVMPPAAPATAAARSFVPGSEWVYADLYEEWGLLDDLLVREIDPFIASLESAGILERWFFLRYVDRKKHVRLRCKSAAAPAELLQRTAAFCKRLSQTSAISHYSLRTYEREIERYGGTLEAVETAEELFCLDSESALRTLRGLGRVGGDRSAASIADADDLVRCFAKDDDPRAWLGGPNTDGSQKLSARERATAKLLSDQLLARPWVPPLAIARCADTYRRLSDDGRLTAPVKSIFHALLHMHYNRRGIMRADEAAVRRIQRQVYGSIWARSAGASTRVPPA